MCFVRTRVRSLPGPRALNRLEGKPVMTLLFAEGFDNRIGVLVLLGFIIIVMLIAFAVFARYIRLWVHSVSTGARIGSFDVLGMSFRKVNPTVIVRSKIMAVQAGLRDESGITSKTLEAHYLAGGNVPLVIRSIIAAKKAKTIDLDFKL